MITNSATRYFPIDGTMTPGKYTLMAKTFEPEEVVCKEEFTWSLRKLEMEDIKFDRKAMGYCLFSVALRKDGDLPIRFSHASTVIDGKRYGAFYSNNAPFMRVMDDGSAVSDRCIIEPQKTLTVGIMGMTEFFLPGNTYKVEVTLFYGENSDKSVGVEKEVLIR